MEAPLILYSDASEMDLILLKFADEDENAISGELNVEFGDVANNFSKHPSNRAEIRLCCKFLITL